jgi:hypothetical protein
MTGNSTSAECTSRRCNAELSLSRYPSTVVKISTSGNTDTNA